MIKLIYNYFQISYHFNICFGQSFSNVFTDLNCNKIKLEKVYRRVLFTKKSSSNYRSFISQITPWYRLQIFGTIGGKLFMYIKALNCALTGPVYTTAQSWRFLPLVQPTNYQNKDKAFYIQIIIIHDVPNLVQSNV